MSYSRFEIPFMPLNHWLVNLGGDPNPFFLRSSFFLLLSSSSTWSNSYYHRILNPPLCFFSNHARGASSVPLCLSTHGYPYFSCIFGFCPLGSQLVAMADMDLYDPTSLTTTRAKGSTILDALWVDCYHIYSARAEIKFFYSHRWLWTPSAWYPGR